MSITDDVIPSEGKFKELALSNYAAWEVVGILHNVIHVYVYATECVCHLFRPMPATSARGMGGLCPPYTRACTMPPRGTRHNRAYTHISPAFGSVSVPPHRMVEGELFPCLRYFGLRFYAYNPVS